MVDLAKEGPRLQIQYQIEITTKILAPVIGRAIDPSSLHEGFYALYTACFNGFHHSKLLRPTLGFLKKRLAILEKIKKDAIEYGLDEIKDSAIEIMAETGRIVEEFELETRIDTEKRNDIMNKCVAFLSDHGFPAGVGPTGKATLLCQKLWLECTRQYVSGDALSKAFKRWRGDKRASLFSPKLSHPCPEKQDVF